MLQIAKTATFYSLIVPPVAFTDLDGVLYGVQSGSILDSKALDGLRDHVTRGATSVPPTSTWNEKRDNFLANAKEIVGLQLAYELLKNLIPQDVYFDRTTDPGIT